MSMRKMMNVSAADMCHLKLVGDTYINQQQLGDNKWLLITRSYPALFCASAFSSRSSFSSTASRMNAAMP